MWAPPYAAASTVVADARVVVGVVVDRDVVHVHVPDDGGVYVRDGAVVVEVIAVPVAAFVASAEVTVAVVNPPVVADVRSPIAVAPHVMAAEPSPVTGGPQGTEVWRDHPRA